MKLLGHTAYEIAAEATREAGRQHVDTNPVVRAYQRVERLLDIPKLESI